MLKFSYMFTFMFQYINRVIIFMPAVSNELCYRVWLLCPEIYMNRDKWFLIQIKQTSFKFRLSLFVYCRLDQKVTILLSDFNYISLMIIKNVYKMNVLSILFCFIYICKCIFNYSLSLRKKLYIFNELNFQIKNANKSTATTYCKQKEMLITIFKYNIIHKKITSKNKLKFVLLKFNLMTIGSAHAYISSII